MESVRLTSPGNDEAAGALPFLKWAGGKRRLVPLIRPHLGKRIRRLVEPFVGSGAVTLALHEEAEELWMNDSNPDLVNVFVQIQSDSSALARKLSTYFTPENNTAERYYELRDLFNGDRDQTADRAALFLYLNRHGYNGLCRYNASGGFNVPFGRYESVGSPEDRFPAAARALRRCRITNVDFESVLDECRAGSAVYCDPPYVPLSASAKFNAYAKGGFGPADQERLVSAARRAAARGAVVVISNHDTKESRDLYEGAAIHPLLVKRNISCNADERGGAKEIIAVFRR